MMTEYYKDEFIKFTKETQASGASNEFKFATSSSSRNGSNGGHSLNSIQKVEMDKIIKAFIEKLMGKNIFESKDLNEQQKIQIIQSMMLFVQSHRYSKGDKFITETVWSESG